MNREGKASKKSHACSWFFWIGDSGSRSEVGKGNKQERKAGTSTKWAWGVNTGNIWAWKEWPNNTAWRNLDQTLGNTTCVYLCLYFSTTFYRFFSAISLHGRCLSSSLLIGCVLFTLYFSVTIKNKKNPLHSLIQSNRGSLLTQWHSCVLIPRSARLAHWISRGILKAADSGLRWPSLHKFSSCANIRSHFLRLFKGYLNRCKEKMSIMKTIQELIHYLMADSE